MRTSSVGSHLTSYRLPADKYCTVSGNVPIVHFGKEASFQYNRLLGREKLMTFYTKQGLRIL
jgi:hypothetical protein